MKFRFEVYKKSYVVKLAIGLCSSAAAIGLGACSVNTAVVVNQPPVIQPGLVKFDLEFGTLSPSSISLFYWPDNMTEEQTQATVKAVNTASGTLDVLASKMVDLGKMLGALRMEFKALDCSGKFAEVEDEFGKDESVPWVDKWREVPAVAPVDPADASDPRYQDYLKYVEYKKVVEALTKCQTNQVSRGAVIDNVEKLQAMARQQVTIFENQIGKENIRNVNPKGTSISIQQQGLGARVEVTLAGFLSDSNVQSTQDQPNKPGKIQMASYDIRARLLRFLVPELDGVGQPTGNQMLFLLERTPDFMGKARFSGDVRLMKNGTVLRHGSAKFEGAFVN